jgi:hypothetical protein
MSSQGRYRREEKGMVKFSMSRFVIYTPRQRPGFPPYRCRFPPLFFMTAGTLKYRGTEADNIIIAST